MGKDLVKRIEKLDIGVNLPGSPGVIKEIPPEMIDSGVEETIRYVINSAFDDPDAMIAKAIKKEIKGKTYTIFVSKGNEQYPVKAYDKIGELFESNPKTGLTGYQKLNFTVSKPRVGGY